MTPADAVRLALGDDADDGITGRGTAGLQAAGTGQCRTSHVPDQ